MPVERRDAQDVAQGRNAPAICADGWLKGYARLHWIHSAASSKRVAKWQNLMHHFNTHNLTRAFHELDGSKASGIDRVTKREYQKQLTENIAALQVAIRRGGWHPRPAREVLIPKPQGGTRPLAVGCLEDKIVQTLTARILEAIFDPLFDRHSY